MNVRARGYAFKAKVWLYMNGTSPAAWHFVNVPKKLSKEIRDTYGGLARGWGSLRVEVTIVDTTWKTSIFPDKKSGTYLLPLKASVREREHISSGQMIKILLTVRM